MPSLSELESENTMLTRFLAEAQLGINVLNVGVQLECKRNATETIPSMLESR